MMHRLWFGLLVVVLGPACDGPVQGDLLIEADDGRSQVYAPSDCVDGAPLGFLGVQIYDDRDRVLDFFIEGDEPALIYYEAGHGAFELGPADCEHFDGKLLREYNARTNNGRVGGHLELDCTTPQGWSVAGSLSFDQCYAPSEEDCDDDDWDDDDDDWGDDDDD